MSFLSLQTERYEDQRARWPQRGRHVLAHYDERSIVVYQAYRPSIGEYAIEHGHFGGPDFSFSRMSWIKPNFLWMMFRSGWGQKDGQEVVLGLRIARSFFDAICDQAVASSYDPDEFDSREAWQRAVKGSDVRLQWDPDHDPHGAAVERRAVQLGLRGSVLQSFATDALLEVIDMRDFVDEQRTHIGSDPLVTPLERVYPACLTSARVPFCGAEARG